MKTPSDPMPASPLMPLARRRRWPWVLSVGLLVALCSAYFAERSRQRSQRTAWAVTELSRLSSLTADEPAVREELEFLAEAQRRSSQPKEDPLGEGFIEWTSEHVLRMTNGSYLCYRFRHGKNDGYVPHLFLARSSDGRYFYSSFHFCTRMGIVRQDDPPGSLSEFMQRYAVREFDGASLECLQQTDLDWRRPVVP